jgi:hypothetical protein
VIACLLWWWRTRRNKLNPKEKKCSGDSLLSQVRFWAGECAQYCSKQKIRGKASRETGLAGTAARYTVKINIVEAFLCREKRLGAGVLLYGTRRGKVRGSGARFIHHLHQCSHVGNSSVRRGSQDSLNLVQGMQKRELDRAPKGMI